MQVDCKVMVLVTLLGMGMMSGMASPVSVAVDEGVVIGEKREEQTSAWTLETTVGLDFSSKQVTYGLIDNPHGILTPRFELAWQHEEGLRLAIGVEALLDTTHYGAKEGGYNNRRWKMQELDPYLAFSRHWRLTEEVAVVTEVGYYYEYHPRSCNKPERDFSNPDAQYLTLLLGLEDGFLNPTLSLEYQIMGYGETDEGEGALYAAFELSHTFDFSEMMGLEEGGLCVTPLAGIAVANKERNTCDLGLDDTLSLRDAYVRLEVAYCPIENLSITPYIACHQQLDATTRDVVGEDDFVAYAGIGMAYTF